VKKRLLSPLFFQLKSLTWFGRDCDQLLPPGWGGGSCGIEVVDLVWKGLRQVNVQVGALPEKTLKSLTWFGRDCDIPGLDPQHGPVIELKSLTWFGRDCD